MPSAKSHTLPRGGAESLLRERLRALLAEARERTLRLIAPISAENLERVHDPLMSPLVWDLGHIAAFEDLWIGPHPLRPELMDVYDATETPRAHRGDLPMLDLAAALDYLDEVRAKTLRVLAHADLTDAWDLVIQHEHQHNETMLQCIQIAEARMYSLPPAEPQRAGPGDMVRIPAGPFPMGAGDRDFAYDNERPRHEVDVPSFEIDRRPVTNGNYARFVDAGGYHDPGAWSPEGWDWRRRTGAERPLYWTADGRERHFDRYEVRDPALPVMHVSWFEADAYARWVGKRLPTEAEWEKAAAWGPHASAPRIRPWGDEPPSPERANVDQLGFGPAGAGGLPAGASAYGVLGMAGDAWEWTAGDLEPYPGFRAHPYEEYSSIFFGGGYKVLRGGSWATRASIARNTFRNWDLPERRQIFSGFRCAR